MIMITKLGHLKQARPNTALTMVCGVSMGPCLPTILAVAGPHGVASAAKVH